MTWVRTSWATTAVTVLLAVAGCGAGAASDEFSFVSPGGQTRIFYDPPESRGTITKLEGEDLLEPNKQIRLSDFLDKVVVLNIWGSWCGPCRTEMPHLQRVYEQTRDLGVQFLGIDVRHRVAAIFLEPLLDSDLLPVVQRVAAETDAAKAAP